MLRSSGLARAHSVLCMIFNLSLCTNELFTIFNSAPFNAVGACAPVILAVNLQVRGRYRWDSWRHPGSPGGVRRSSDVLRRWHTSSNS